MIFNPCSSMDSIEKLITKLTISKDDISKFPGHVRRDGQPIYEFGAGRDRGR